MKKFLTGVCLLTALLVGVSGTRATADPSDGDQLQVALDTLNWILDDNDPGDPNSPPNPIPAGGIDFTDLNQFIFNSDPYSMTEAQLKAAEEFCRSYCGKADGFYNARVILYPTEGEYPGS